MNNKLKLVALAFTPFIIGNIFSFLLVKPFLGMVLSLAFLAFWFWVGFVSYKLVKSPLVSVLLGNCFGILSILILAVSGIFLKSYPNGILGYQLQMYFLAAIKLPSALLQLILRNISGNLIFIFAFIIMLVVYYIGFLVGRKKQPAY